MHLVEMALLHRQRHKPKESVVSQVSTTTYQINTFHGILDFCAIRLDPSSFKWIFFFKDSTTQQWCHLFWEEAK